METIEKLKILSADSQYDLACACGTQKHEHRKRGQDGKRREKGEKRGRFYFIDKQIKYDKLCQCQEQQE